MKTIKPTFDRRVLTWWLVGSVGVLLLAFVASTVSNEFNWDAFDFVFAALFFTVTGIVVSLIAGSVSMPQRLVLMVGAGLLAALIWADLAVGLFGLPWSGS